MTVSHSTMMKKVQVGYSPGECNPLNLFNDFAELSALLLSALEMAAAGLSSQNEALEESMRGTENPLRSLQERNAHLLDAFLLAVGMHQILEDHLHRDTFALAKVSKIMSHLLPNPVADRAAAGVERMARIITHLRALPLEERRLRKYQQALSLFVQQLANEIAHRLSTGVSEMREPVDGYDQELQAAKDFLQAGRQLHTSLASAPKALRRSVVRLPSCFRSFDQRLEDCQRIIQQFAQRWPERSTPLMVVGVRTSGSYLAPLYAAFLRVLGYERVQTWTIRPGDRWLPGERDWVIKHLQPGGRVLLVDDPPVTGKSIAKTARTLERIGIARQSISVVVSLFGVLADLPPALADYDFVGLPWEEWSIQQQLTPASVEKSLTDLLVDRTIQVAPAHGRPTLVRVAGVRVVERLPLLPEAQRLSLPLSLPVEGLLGLVSFRGHVRGLYRVEVLDDRSGTWLEHLIYVKGTGLGYLGAHSLTLANTLSQFLPEIYGVRNGLLYRAWLPEARRVSRLATADAEALAEHMARYVAAHEQLLALPEDVTGRLAGRHTLWQRGNENVAYFVFGRITPLLRPVLLGMAKYLLHQSVKHPAVIDGAMAPRAWFLAEPASDAQGDAAKTFLKVEFDDRVFCNLNLDCSDVFYDLASAAAYYEVLTGDEGFSDLLRQRYGALTGTTCSDERWLLYQLITLQLEGESLLEVLRLSQTQPQGEVNGARPDEDQPSEASIRILDRASIALEAVQRTSSRVCERYIGERFVSDLVPASSGALCAIDIDGVLETNWNISVGTTPLGALALRALMRHGYRPVLATGRSIDEVRERCQSYRLAGGMAEYGSVIYNHLTGETRVLLTPAEQDDLDALRTVLSQMEGVFISPAHRYSVRAYRMKQGERRALKPEIIEQALQQVPGRERLRTIQGIAQTDFMVIGVDKGTGLAALAKLWGGSAEDSTDTSVLAFAAGDTVSDLAMFRLAGRAFAPANADTAVRAAAQAKGSHIRVMQHSYEAGLLQAVSQLVGHDPRRCSTCRPLACPDEARLLLTLFGARDAHRWGKLRQAVLLAWHLVLAKWRENRK